MDRNNGRGGRCKSWYVALRKESVDRNIFPTRSRPTGAVALRKESVDRNLGADQHGLDLNGVALRKESVDRNPTIKAMRGDRKASLSARRAWIEIPSADS